MLTYLAAAAFVGLAVPEGAVFQDTTTRQTAQEKRDSAGRPPRPGPDSAALATAYLDAGARQLVRLARERRRAVDRSIEAYETTATERITVGLRALRRDRLLWQREVASRIAWTRDGPVRIEVLAAREALPMVVPEAKVPGDLAGYMPRLAFDPADPYLLTGWDDQDGDVPHPLAPGGEVDYRFRSGDTTVIRLADGRQVRLLELEVIPRRKAWGLVQGSFWLDDASHAVVQATLRMADDFDLERDDDAEDVPGILKPIRARVEYFTIEYGLWDFEWWLPRVFAVRGVASIGRFASVPLIYERTYTGYDVTGEPGTAATLDVDETEYASGRRVRCPTRVVVNVAGPGTRDSASRADTARTGRRRSLTEEQRRSCERYEVIVPDDSASLLTGDALPAPPFTYAEALLTEFELRSIRDQLGSLAPTPFQIERPKLTGPLGSAGLVRYNRVEGLSLGARVDMDLGPLQAAATARLGVADLEPNGELSLLREGTRSRLQVTGYRRLAAMDPEARPFSLASSFSSLALGRDEADYYRTLGVELAGEPPLSRPRWYDWRLYAQRERAARKETDFSVPYLFDRDTRFPANDSAASATQYGLALRLRGAWGHDPVGLRAGADLGVEAAAGTFEYGRPSLGLRLGLPLPGRFLGFMEAAGGTTVGEPALQHLWRVGGPATLRGYDSGAMLGESFWRGRAEVGTRFPAARLILFSDAGWAGPTSDLGSGPWLLSGGIGVGLLDGLIRFDLARALKSPTGWRFTAYLDAWL